MSYYVYIYQEVPIKIFYLFIYKILPVLLDLPIIWLSVAVLKCQQNPTSVPHRVCRFSVQNAAIYTELIPKHVVLECRIWSQSASFWY